MTTVLTVPVLSRHVNGDPTWDFLNPASKDRVLALLADQTGEMLELLGASESWEAPTACAGWEIRDMAGHLVDATEDMVGAIEAARTGREVSEPVGFAGMATAYDSAARSFRTQPRAEVLARLRAATTRLIEQFGEIDDRDWMSLVVADHYAGPLPAFVHATALLAGITVHVWDVREGMGVRHGVSADAAAFLAPFVPLFLQATANTSSVQAPFVVGVRTLGRNQAETRFEVTNGGVHVEQGDLADCAVIIDVDPGTLLLLAYGRVNAGTIQGDPDAFVRFRALSVAI